MRDAPSTLDTEHFSSPTQQPIFSRWDTFSALFGVAGSLVARSISEEKAIEGIRYLFDIKEHAQQIALAPVDIVGDAWNALPEFTRDLISDLHRINALNALIDDSNELPKCVFVSSGDPFGENEMIWLNHVADRQRIREIRDNGGFESPAPFRYEPIFLSDNPVSDFFRSMLTHVAEITVVSRLPLIAALGPTGSVVAAHGIVDFHYADGTFSDKMMSGLTSAMFARYVEHLFHRRRDLFQLEPHSWSHQITQGVAEFVMEGLWHQVNHGFQHLVHDAVQHLGDICEAFNSQLVKKREVYWLEQGSVPENDHEYRMLIPQRFNLSLPVPIQQAGFFAQFTISRLSMPQVLGAPVVPAVRATGIEAPPPVLSMMQPHFLPDHCLGGAFYNPWIVGNGTKFFYGGFSSRTPSMLGQSPVSWSDPTPHASVSQLPVSVGALEPLTLSLEVASEEKPLLADNLVISAQLEQTNISSVSSNKLDASTNLNSLGELKFNLHCIPSGFHVSVASVNNFSGFNASFGIQFTGLDSLATTYLNRSIFPGTEVDREVIRYGEIFRLKIKEIGGLLHSYDRKLTLTCNSTDEHTTIWFKLQEATLGNEKNQPILQKVFQSALDSLMPSLFNKAKGVFDLACTQALSNKNYAEARRLHQEFFSKFGELSGDVAINGQMIAQQITAHQIAYSSEPELRVLLQSSEFINEHFQVRARLDNCAIDRVTEALKSRNVVAANNACGDIHDPGVQQKVRAVIVEIALASKEYDAVLAICNSMPLLEERIPLETEARRGIVESCAVERLKTLRVNEAYADLWALVDERLDNNKAQNISQRFMNETENALNCAEAYDECSAITDEKRRVQLLFSLSSQQYKIAQSSEGIELVAEGCRRALAIDPAHRDATKLLSNCYLRQEKFQDALDLVETRILVGQPKDSFGLLMKGVVLCRNGERMAGRKILTELLERDSGSLPEDGVDLMTGLPSVSEVERQLVYSEMASDYAREARDLRKTYCEERTKRSDEVRNVNHAGRKIETLIIEVDQAQKYLAKIDRAIEKQKNHAAQIKSLVMQEGADNPVCPRTLADHETASLQSERKVYEEQFANDKNLLMHATDHFNIQFLQLSTDAAFFLGDLAMTQCWWRDEHNELTPWGQKLQNGMKLVKAPVSSVEQLLAHNVAWHMRIAERKVQQQAAESALSVGLNQARYVLLGAQVIRGVMRWFERNKKDLPSNFDEWSKTEQMGFYMDGYALPIGQLGFSAGCIAIDSSHFVPDVLAFSPEMLMQIPPINNYLLQPNPSDYLAQVRFMVGKTLERLNVNNQSLSTIEQVLGDATQALSYVTPFSEPFAMMSRSLLSIAFSAATIDSLFNVFASLSAVYLLCRTTQLGLAFYTTYKNYNSHWIQHCLGFLRQEFNQQIPALGDKTFQQNSLFFKKIKEDLRYLFAKLPIVNAELRKFYILTVYFQHFFSSIKEHGVTLADGNCLFHSVSQCCGIDHVELRQLTVGYERAHRQEFVDKHLILDLEFDLHIHNMSQVATRSKSEEDQQIQQSRWGTIAEVHALSKVLNRPILVVLPNGGISSAMNHLSLNLAELTGEPIFLLLQENHYTPMLLRGEYYFECDYAKYLAAQKQQWAQTPIQEPAAYRREILQTHQQLMVTYDSVQAKAAACEEALDGLTHTRTETDRLIVARDELSRAMDEKVTLFLRVNAEKPKETIARTIFGIGFVENTGLTREEEMAFASSVLQMTNE